MTWRAATDSRLPRSTFRIRILPHRVPFTRFLLRHPFLSPFGNIFSTPSPNLPQEMLGISITHPDTSLRLRRSHVTVSTAMSTAGRSIFKGTVNVLCSYCGRSYCSCRVPSEYLWTFFIVQQPQWHCVITVVIWDQHWRSEIWMYRRFPHVFSIKSNSCL